MLGLVVSSLLLLFPSSADAIEIKKIPAKFKPLTKVGLEFSLDSKNQNIQFLIPGAKSIVLKKKYTNKAQIGAQFLKEYSSYFGLKNTQATKLIKSTVSASGVTHLKYVQQYNKVPVYGGEMILHIKGDGAVSAAQGKIAQNLTLSTKSKITAKKATELVKKYAKDKLAITAPATTKPILFIYNPITNKPTAKDKNVLVWVMEVDDVDYGNLRTVFIDAINGRVVDSMSRVGAIYREIKDCNDVLGGGCYITGAPAGLSNGRIEAGAVANAADVNIIFNNLLDAYNYFRDNFNIFGPNNRGGAGNGVDVATDTLKAFARYVLPATNKFAPCPNAYWDGVEFVFCSSTANTPIIAHEYMHAVTQYQGPQPQLSYEQQPGTINEAYSDIFAMAVQKYALNWEPSWSMGVAGQAPFRNIMEPWNTHNPSKLYNGYFSCDPVWDDGGVHRNSTVISYAAYLLSKGGGFNGCTIPAIGLDKVTQIFYLTLTQYLPTNAQFSDLNRNLPLACEELYEHNSTECNALRIALQAVELDQEWPCPAGTKTEATPVCALPQVTLDENVLTPNIPTNTIITAPTNNLSDYVVPVIQTPAVILLPTTSTPAVFVPAPVVDTGDKYPSFTASVSDDGLRTYTIEGTFNYYGTKSGCTGPRYFDPIIVAWGQVDTHPAVDGNNHFTTTHVYNVKNSEYDISVSFINSCFQRTTKTFTVHPKF